MPGLRTARLALGSVAVVVVIGSSACVSSAVCTSDADCAAFGQGSVCVRGERPEGLCTDGDLSLDDVNPPRLDAGPPDGGETGVLSIDVQLRPESVPPGEPVSLEWNATAAVSCTVTAKARHEAEPRQVPNASTDVFGDVDVEVDQDTTFTVTCVDADGVSESRSEAVDVETAGDLWAADELVDVGGVVELHWQTFGAEACALHDGGGAAVYAIEASELVAGSTTLPASDAPFALFCDGVELDVVPVNLLAVTDLAAEPSALGPGGERVTLTWSYSGPGGCRVYLDGAASHAVDLDQGAPGHQVDLSGTTEVAVRCDGRDGPLPEVTLEVPQLIRNFAGPSAPVAYGAGVTFHLDVDESASCTIRDAAGGVLSNPIASVGASLEAHLECNADGKQATAATEVLVLPAPPVVRGTLVSDDDSGLRVAISVETSPNAVACALEPTTGAAPALERGTADGHVLPFVGELVPVADTGAVGFSATCFSDDAHDLSTSSSEPLRIHVGSVSSTNDLDDLGAASLLIGDVTLFNIDTLSSLDALASVRELSGSLTLQGLDNSALTNLDPLRLERVLGNVIIAENSKLLTVGLASPEGDGGLAWLREVGGDLVIDDNATLLDAPLPRLLSVGGDLEVTENGNLNLISLPSLHTVGGSFTLENNDDLDNDEALVFAALTKVGGEFKVSGTSLNALGEYFPVLDEVGGRFVVTFNAALACTDAGAVYCALSVPPAAADVNVSANQGSCSWTPSCPTP